MAERALVTKDALRLFGPRWNGSKADERSDIGLPKGNVSGTIDWSLEVGIHKSLDRPLHSRE